MPSNKAYSRFAMLYDWVMDGVKYEMWADYVCRIVEKFGVQGKDLLDLACGTGNTSFTMARRGYRVTGVDLSPEMIEVAHLKAKHYEAPQQKPSGSSAASGPAPVTFLCQDMRSLSLGRQFDVITCLFDSINYITNPQDLIRVFAGVKTLMKRHSLLIFDINTERQLAKTGASSPTLFEKGEDVALFWRDEWSHATKTWRVRLDGFIKNQDRYDRFTEIHEERAYSIEEVEKALQESGFARVHCYDAYSFAPPRADSGRLYFVARL